MVNPPPETRTYWQLAVFGFFQMSGWLVGPPIAALFLGRWLDSRFQTKPWLLLLTLAIAFTVSSIGITKEAKRIAAEVDKDLDTKKAAGPKPPKQ